MALTENQKERIKNIDAIYMSASLIGLVAGIVYAKKTGGHFWRYVGWSFAGSLALGLPAMLITTPFKNKILKEGDASTSTSTGKQENVIPGNATPDQFDKLVEKAKGSSNIFYGLSTEKFKELLNKWTANLTKSDAEVLITTMGKKEKDWTPTERIKFTELFIKWTGKHI